MNTICHTAGYNNEKNISRQDSKNVTKMTKGKNVVWRLTPDGETRTESTCLNYQEKYAGRKHLRCPSQNTRKKRNHLKPSSFTFSTENKPTKLYPQTQYCRKGKRGKEERVQAKNIQHLEKCLINFNLKITAILTF